MKRHDWAYFCWPGLWSLWRQGAVSGFLLAFGAGLSLNLLLLSTLVYTEMLTPPVRNYGWLVLAVVWIGAAVGSYGWRRWQDVRRKQSDQNDLLATATVEYLRGNWYQAELSLWQALKHDRRDVDALLMLAAICRHTDRLDEAQRQLDELELLERSGKWQAEIAAERRLIARKRNRTTNETDAAAPASNRDEPREPQTDQLAPIDGAGEQTSQIGVDISGHRAA